MKTIRERSGTVNSNSKIVALIYLLIRDHVTCGHIESIVDSIQNEENEFEFSNGYIANYAKDIEERLK